MQTAQIWAFAVVEIVERRRHRTTSERPKIVRRTGLVQGVVSAVGADRSSHVANRAARRRTEHIANDVWRLTVSADRIDRGGEQVARGLQVAASCGELLPVLCVLDSALLTLSIAGFVEDCEV